MNGLRVFKNSPPAKADSYFYGGDCKGNLFFTQSKIFIFFELKKIEEPLIKKYALEWIKYTLDGHEFSASLTESFKVKYKLILDTFKNL